MGCMRASIFPFRIVSDQAVSHFALHRFIRIVVLAEEDDDLAPASLDLDMRELRGASGS